jgi:NAD(P)-dependent dehydrogenase (short-subunit alcohol dehydrogenase family)
VALANAGATVVGTPAVLVNNAGIDGPRGADEVDFSRTLNVLGVHHATQVSGGAMCEARRGSIVSIGSLYASPIPALYDHIDPPFTKLAAYGASKAGVNLTRYLARLWGRTA